MSAQQTLTREIIDPRYVDLRDQNLAAAAESRTASSDSETRR